MNGHAAAIGTVLVLLAGTAHANWRDGCPVYAPPPRGTPEHDAITNNWGSSTELDSAIGPDRITFLSRGAYFMSSPGFARTRMHTAVAHLSLSTPWRTDVESSFRVGGSLTQAFANTSSEPADADVTDDQEDDGAFGNLVVNAWVRRSWLNGDWRGAWAVRGFVGLPTLEAIEARPDILRHERELLAQYAARSTFEPQLFSRYAFGIVYERRSELRGCYGLFAEFRVAAVLHLASYGDNDWASVEASDNYLSLLPSLAVGLHVSDEVSAYVQGGIHFDRPSNEIGGRTNPALSARVRLDNQPHGQTTRPPGFGLGPRRPPRPDGRLLRWRLCRLRPLLSDLTRSSEMNRTFLLLLAVTAGCHAVTIRVERGSSGAVERDDKFEPTKYDRNKRYISMPPSGLVDCMDLLTESFGPTPCTESPDGNRRSIALAAAESARGLAPSGDYRAEAVAAFIHVSDGRDPRTRGQARW